MPTKTDFPPIRALLFDMDGLLLNTEDIYTLITNAILQNHSLPPLPWSIKSQLQGRPGPASYVILQQWSGLPLTYPSFLAHQSALQHQHFPTAEPLPGAEHLLQTLHQSPSKVALALATSSHAANFTLKTAHWAEMFAVFEPELRVLGDDGRIGSGRGKPAPDIYVLALAMVNERARGRGEREVRREECLVLEDSVVGVEAGRRAGMRVLWCPHPELSKEYEGREKEVLAGLTRELDKDGDGDDDGRETVGLEGWPGSMDDGWAEMVSTLLDFDYEKYGIRIGPDHAPDHRLDGSKNITD